MEILETSREILASPEQVFAAMTTPERLARWWGPKGFTNTFEICEIRPGGKWLFTMQGPDGKDYKNVSEFGEIIPPQKLVVKHLCEPFFTAIFTLEPTNKGTLLKWVSKFENKEFVDNSRDFLKTANEQNIDRLVEEVNKYPSDIEVITQALPPVNGVKSENSN